MYFFHNVNLYDDDLNFVRSHIFTSKEKAINFANSCRVKYGKVTVETMYAKS